MAFYRCGPPALVSEKRYRPDGPNRVDKILIPDACLQPRPSIAEGDPHVPAGLQGIAVERNALSHAGVGASRARVTGVILNDDLFRDGSEENQ